MGGCGLAMNAASTSASVGRRFASAENVGTSASADAAPVGGATRWQAEHQVVAIARPFAALPERVGGNCAETTVFPVCQSIMMVIVEMTIERCGFIESLQ